MAEFLSNESFTRWINGNASYSEKQRWEAWEQEDPANRELSSYAEIFYQMRLELDPAEDLEVQFNRLNQQIERAKKQKKISVFKNIQPNYKSMGYRAAVAATVVLLMSIAGLISLYNSFSPPGQYDESIYKTVETGFGETSSLKFSDGSMIRLNAKSSLRYNLDQFSSNRVDVWLQGEGYFDIASNPGGDKREFIIHTDDGKIRVLGTKFNVNSRFQQTTVVLEKGRVDVSRNGSQFLEADSKELKPGERAVIDKTLPDIKIQNVDVEMFKAWVHGEMEFRNTSLKDILTSVEATYNIKLDVESPELLKRKITGVVQNPDLQFLLTALQEILDVQIKQVNKNKYLISRQSINHE